MKKSQLAMSASILLAACTAGSAIWSPIACGCIEPWMDLAAELKLEGIDDSSDLTAEKVQTALSNKFVGRTADAKVLPDLGNADLCTKTSPSSIDCNWWLWESGLRQKGLKAHFALNSSGFVDSIRVTNVLRP